MLQFSVHFMVLVMLHVQQITARYERVGYVSDPVQLLVQGNFPSSSSQNQEYSPIKRQYKQEEKRLYTIIPPFYSKFDFDDIPVNRRHIPPPFTDFSFSAQ